ncbi:3-hydroxyacyl-CoA dehydrogenase, partial [Gordonia amicalis]|nr:3-hydroxyacyl-CoA dehydrogenase [Gordonia amicalis]
SASHGHLRGVVHCAGRGGDRLRILDRQGAAAPLQSFRHVLEINLIGTYNLLRLGAEQIAQAETVDTESGERG